MFLKSRKFIFLSILLLNLHSIMVLANENEIFNYGKNVLGQVVQTFLITLAAGYAVKILGFTKNPSPNNTEFIKPRSTKLTLKNYVGTIPKGIDSLIKQMKENDYKQRCQRFNLPILKGVLFAGPPGTGKSLLANVVAGELGFPIFMPNNLTDKYVGETEKNITAVFKSAQKEALKNKHKAAIVFFDEIESIAAKRGGWLHQVGCVTTLLREIDKKNTTDCGQEVNIIVIGATNDPSMIDKAVLSRFGTTIGVMLPDTLTAQKMLSHHFKKSGAPLSKNIHYSWLALLCNGMSARDIESVCENARRIAVDSPECEKVETKHVLEAIEVKKKSIKNNRMNFLKHTKNDTLNDNAVPKKQFQLPIWVEESFSMSKVFINLHSNELCTPILREG